MNDNYKIERKQKSKVEDMSALPQILLAEVRDKNGAIVGIRHCDFKAGLVIDRCGRKYRLDEHGAQRRIK